MSDKLEGIVWAKRGETTASGSDAFLGLAVCIIDHYLEGTSNPNKNLLGFGV